MHKRKRAGNTITRKINSTKDTAAKADKNHYISNSYLEGFIPIDTEYFTASLEKGGDDYTGSYEADYSDFTGTELLFGGTTLEREGGSTLNITCTLSLENGSASVFLRSGSDDPVVLLSESGTYTGTVEVNGASTYIGVWGEHADGSVSIEIE